MAELEAGVTLFMAAVYYLITGGAAGAFSSLIGWAAGNEPFSGRKMFVSIAIGIGAGLIASMVEVAKLQSLGVTSVDGLTLLYTIMTIFTSAGFGALATAKGIKIMGKATGTAPTA